MLAFYPYAARILENLVRVARDEQPILQGFVHSIAALLKTDSVNARPGVAIAEARRNTLDLVRELKILDRNIHAYIQRVLDDITTAADILEESFERYRRKITGNYHRLKTVDNLYKWRAEILARIDQLERSSLLLDAAARWVAEERRVDHTTALALVNEDLALIRVEFERLPALMESIDRRHARFSAAALRKLAYLLRHDRRIEGQLQKLIDVLPLHDDIDVDVDVFRCEFLVGDSFWYTPQKRRQPQPPQVLQQAPEVDEDAARKTAIVRLQRKASRTRVDEWVRALLAGRSEVDRSAARSSSRMRSASPSGSSGNRRSDHTSTTSVAWTSSYCTRGCLIAAPDESRNGSGVNLQLVRKSRLTTWSAACRAFGRSTGFAVLVPSAGREGDALAVSELVHELVEVQAENRTLPAVAHHRF